METITLIDEIHTHLEELAAIATALEGLMQSSYASDFSVAGCVITLLNTIRVKVCCVEELITQINP